MYLYELLEILNDNSFIILYDASQNTIGRYDGKDSIDLILEPKNGENESLEISDFMVVDIFPDSFLKVHAIGIELELELSDYNLYMR